MHQPTFSVVEPQSRELLKHDSSEKHG